jgi:hypothetical protein
MKQEDDKMREMEQQPESRMEWKRKDKKGKERKLVASELHRQGNGMDIQQPYGPGLSQLQLRCCAEFEMLAIESYLPKLMSS